VEKEEENNGEIETQQLSYKMISSSNHKNGIGSPVVYFCVMSDKAIFLCLTSPPLFLK